MRIIFNDIKANELIYIHITTNILSNDCLQILQSIYSKFKTLFYFFLQNPFELLVFRPSELHPDIWPYFSRKFQYFTIHRPINKTIKYCTIFFNLRFLTKIKYEYIRVLLRLLVQVPSLLDGRTSNKLT